MKSACIFWCAIPVLLAGCAAPVDDPDNPSVRGKWVKTVRFVSHRLNGGSVDPATLGIAIENPPPEEICGELAFRDASDWAKTLGAAAKGTCTVETHEVVGNRLNTKLKCVRPSEGENKFDLIIYAKGVIGPNSARIDAEEVNRVTMPTGETHRLTSDVVAEATRTGDC